MFINTLIHSVNVITIFKICKWEGTNWENTSISNYLKGLWDNFASIKNNNKTKEIKTHETLKRGH